MSEDRWEAKYVDCIKRYEQMALAWENSRERHLSERKLLRANNDLLAKSNEELLGLLKGYKVHENKYAVPLIWKSDSRMGEEHEGFVVGVDEGAGIRALVQENATLQAQVEKLREALESLTGAASKPLVNIVKRWPENVSHVVDRLEIHQGNSKILAKAISDAQEALATSAQEGS